MTAISDDTPNILTVNGGSSGIKFALFEVDSLRHLLVGEIAQVGETMPAFA